MVLSRLIATRGRQARAPSTSNSTGSDADVKDRWSVVWKEMVLHDGRSRAITDVDESVRGMLIGPQGGTIKRLQEATSANVDLNNATGRLRITGEQSDVETIQAKVEAMLRRGRRQYGAGAVTKQATLSSPPPPPSSIPPPPVVPSNLGWEYSVIAGVPRFHARVSADRLTPLFQLHAQIERNTGAQLQMDAVEGSITVTADSSWRLIEARTEVEKALQSGVDASPSAAPSLQTQGASRKKNTSAQDGRVGKRQEPPVLD